MLLLLASPLAAQQNCHIFDLTASVVQLDPVSCQFFVVLNFQHDATTNQFTVHGNGTNYGAFPYGQVPLTLGPLTASPNSPTTLEFIVQDAVFQDCLDEVVLTVPACNGTANCDISNLTVTVGDCNPNTGTYNITVDFQDTNPGNAFFGLWAGNGVPLGTFPLASLPLTIPNFPWGGGAVDVLKVCINDQPNCCETLEFVAPTCFPQGCGIFNLTVNTGDCLSDSTYKALIDFDLLNVPPTDSFKLYLDGVLQGVYGLNQLPIPAIFETSGNAGAVVKVCINQSAIPFCCLEKDFAVPTCHPPCAIEYFKVETDSCTSDSTFGVWVNVQVADSSAVDSFALWGNGQPLGHFGLNQLPLHIPNFAWNGLIFNSVRVCTGNDPGCCKELQFLAPDCLPFDTCEVTNIFVQTGACTSDSTYKVVLNFNATNPGNGTFIVWANGTVLDTFNLSEAPITIPNFPWNGGPNDVITVCIGGSNVPGTTLGGCCKTKEFPVPSCLGTCDIFDLHVVAGDCDPNSNTYPITINFGVTHPGNALFDVWANGEYLGSFPLNQLPLTIPHYEASGNAVDVIKVCINDQPNCCAITEFETPNCGGQDCHIFDLMVQVGDCNPAGGYKVTINFNVTNPGNDLFDVWANGQLFGTFPLNQLPLVIPNFPAGGNPVDLIKVCINDHPDCCISAEFLAPICDDCAIFDLHVDTGDCNPDSTYHLTLNFGYSNTTATEFTVFGNGINLGVFNINQLPLHIPNFPWDGAGPNDFLKVCFVGNNVGGVCCETIEFPTPACLHGNCDINDLHVDTGACTSDSTYVLSFGFQVVNPPANTFGVWANGQFLGMYGLGQLPITIQNFPWNGGNNDVLKVCFAPNAAGTPACCAEIEFAVPTCLGNNNDCEIFDMVVDPGDCTSDSTYNAVLNFQVQNPLSNTFSVWANGTIFGTFNLSQLPLVLQNVPWNGGNNDVIKVCFVSPNGVLGCCKTIEFPVPDCLGNGGNCEIFGMVVDPGDCSSDSTYSLFLNFQAQNPPGNIFGVWANGVFQGTFNLNQLPLNFPNFPWNGGVNDVVKVCFLDNAGTATCCRSLEFEVPTCLGNNDDCHIWDVVAIRTGCLCGQFFVALTFNHDNGSSGGYDVVGNGNNYGNHPYNAQQPIILGPFPGDGTTVYEFGVTDHENGNCEDGFVLGIVECETAVADPGSASSLVISPNPASNWVNVTAMLENGANVGQAAVKVYHADGRLLQTQMVGNAASFQLDVSHLPSGVFRLSIEASAGRLDGTFTKQ